MRVGDDGDRGDGRAHPRLVGVVHRTVEDLVVGLVDRCDELVEGVLGVAGQVVAKSFDRHLAGDLAGQVAAHAVGDDEQVLADVVVVLVLGTQLPFVCGGAPPQLGHHWASKIVAPICTRSPTWRARCWLTRVPLTYVPFLLTMSSTTTLPPINAIVA